jgi:predicted deacylase
VILGGQHGDEGFGVLAVARIGTAVDPATLSGTVIAIPIANAAAFESGRHHSPLDMQDMNRVHPGNPRGTTTEQVSAKLFESVFPGADLVLDLHGGSPELGNIPFVRWTAVAGAIPVRSIAESLGIRHLASPTDRKIPGMLSLALEEIGVPSISIEVGSAFTPTAAAVSELSEHVRRILAHAGMLPLEESARASSPGDTCYTRLAGFRATAPGLWSPLCALGEPVVEGQHLGDVYDASGTVVQRVVCAEPGDVGVLRTAVRVSAGESLVWVLVSDPISD